MNLTHIVRTLADGLDGKFLQFHVAVDNLLQSLDGGIHRTVTAGSSLEAFAGDVQSQTCHRTHTHTACHLQELQLDVVVVGTVGTGEHQNVVVGNVLLLVGKFQEVLIDLVQLVLLHLHAQHVQTVLQGGTTASGSQYDGIVVDTHILRVDDFVSLHILQHTVLMNTR